jgi:Amt family ammonium transporter
MTIPWMLSVCMDGVGGLWGALATGLFASTAVNPAGRDGLFFGNPQLFAVQAMDAFSIMGYSMVVTFIILKFIDLVVGLRVTTDDEVQGLDITQHSEIGYTL